MRPLNLTLENFGPYQNVQIDFTKFLNAPLFLISGKTGSGKTTIFDGICYALFGKTSGDERTASQMRSLFAKPTDKTKVILEFEHQGKTYKITREPTYEYRNNKGSNSTHTAKNSLEYRDSMGELIVLTKKRDVDNFISNLLHLNAQQFTQIVLLPQQKFRKFLTADSDEKEKVLRQVFGTEIFAQWTEKIKENVRKKKQQSEMQTNQLETLMNTVKLNDDDYEKIKAPNDWLEVVQNYVVEKEKILVQKQSELKRVQGKIEQLMLKFQKQKLLADRLQKLKNVEKEIKALQQKQDYIQNLKIQVQNLKWALNNKTLMNEITQGRKKLDEDNRKLTTFTTKLETIENEKQLRNNELLKLNNQKEKYHQLELKQQELQSKLPLFDQVADLQLQLNKIDEQYQKEKEVKFESEKKLATANDRLLQLRNEVLDLSDLINEINQIQRNNDSLEQLEKSLQELVEDDLKVKQLKNGLDEEKRHFEQQNKIYQQCKETRENYQDYFAKNQIAYYAQQLKEGTPCPVCGSIEHPHLAKFDSKIPQISEQQVKDAQEKENKALRKFSELKTKVQDLDEQIVQKNNEYIKRLKEYQIKAQTKESNLTILKNELMKKIKEAASRLDDLSEEKHSQELKKKQIPKIENEIKLLTEASQEAQNKVNQLEKRNIEVKTQLRNQQNNLPKDYLNRESLEEAIEKMKQSISAFDQQLKKKDEQVQELDRAFTSLKANKRQLEEIVVEERTILEKNEKDLKVVLDDKQVSEKQLLDWLKNVGQIEQNQFEISRYEENLYANQKQQKELCDKVTGKEMPDLDLVQKQQREASEKGSQLSRQCGEIKNEYDRLNEIYHQVEKLWGKQKENQRELDELSELSQVIVNGTSARKLGLERFVLREYFKEVLHVASQILEKITNGRYTFILQQTAERNVANQTGLGIDIYDDEAGETRSVRTLSGGESFIAALSLALALGEVIQRQNGGTQIETLFIDEGFGSLDEESLQVALETLRSLESQNRMIGIISHVQELHAQIPDQINVITHNGQSEIQYKIK